MPRTTARRRTALPAAVALAALSVPALVVAVAPAPAVAAGELTATFSQSSVWGTGYGADYALRNQSSATVTSWVVEFDLPAGSTVSNSWNSVRTRDGQHYRFDNASWNGTLAPGGTQGFGFNVAGLGTPVNCTVNGAPCAGGSTPSTPPVSASPTPTPTASPTGSPTTSPTGSPTASPTGSPTPVPTGSVVPVSTAAELSAALAAALPGQTIRLAAGTYHGVFRSQRPGTAAAPITLVGPQDAVLVNDGPSGSGPSCPAPVDGWDSGYGLWLYAAPYWNLTGFAVADSKKGIVLDRSPHVTIDGVTVRHIDEEGVHFRSSSADGVIRNSTVTDTGLVQPGYGEGIYLGSAQSNFTCYADSTGTDRSDRVQVLNNRIGPDVRAEHVDIKEGTTGGVLRGNVFDGQGISGQNSGDSWVDVKGNGYLLEGNVGTFTAPGTFANGYETHNLLDGYGCGNIWRDNRSDLGGVGGYAIRVSSVSRCADNPNVVYASNTVTGAVSGLTNITVTD
ncbi:cellulose binding domain-containing protein [Plantactinospora sp. KBS50]|uniref:cellulose binding domain-containing protein n=1 Tax=Plantactinospora sp. KBS50 TaxID=2024580 RepID=UPI001E48781C|nr:cellulose binding domain-containing protein [Plantactinospora sp. KBS50]